MKRESQFELCPFLVSPQNNLLQSNFSKRTRTVWIVKAPRKRRATSTINSETAKRCNFDFVTCPISQRRLGSRFLRLYLPAMNSLTQDPIRAKLEAESVKAVAESGKVSHSHFSHIDIAEFEHTSLCSRASHERTTCFVNHQKYLTIKIPSHQKPKALEFFVSNSLEGRKREAKKSLILATEEDTIEAGLEPGLSHHSTIFNQYERKEGERRKGR